MKSYFEKCDYIAPFFSAVLAVVSWYFACQTTFPWCDELVLADKSANWAISGTFYGYVWPQAYNMTYPLSLALAFKILGVGHETVCFVTILCAFLASLALLATTRRRGLLKGEWSRLLFVALFWCAGCLPWIYANGRLDSMTMLFTVLFIDALWPDSTRTGRKSLVLTSLWAFLLMLTSVYMLPLMFVIGLLALALCEHDARPALIRRGLTCALTFTIAYAVMFVFYLFKHEPIRFAGFYLYFNTITGFCPTPLAQRIAGAYINDIFALGLVAFSMIMAVLQKNIRVLGFGLFIAAVPTLMTIMGRYAAYYAWAFYVPAILLVAIMLPKRYPRSVAMTLTVAVLAYGCFKQTQTYNQSETNRLVHNQAAEFVRSHASLWGTNVDVVVAQDVYDDASFFYPLLKTGSRLWFRGVKTLTDPSDTEKFEAGLSGLIKDPTQREAILKKFMAYQRCMPTLPASALFLFPTPASHDTIVPLLRERGYTLEAKITESNGISIERWTRSSGILL